MRPLVHFGFLLGVLHYSLARTDTINQSQNSTRLPLIGTDLTETNQVHNFVSRPDIKPARWNVTVHNEKRVAPGYWFAAPMESNTYREPGGSWIGPHIIDGNGQLVWSGSHLFNNTYVVDFKVVDVGGGKQMLFAHGPNAPAYLLDDHYRVKRTVLTAGHGTLPDTHDFHPVDGSTRFLYLQRVTERMSANAIGFNGSCGMAFSGFEERDIMTNEKLFDWNATSYIPLSDSTLAIENVERWCRYHLWDYL